MTAPAPHQKPLPPNADRDDRYTPTALVRTLDVQAITAPDLAECRGFIRKHSKSFYFSSLLLPKSFRHEAWALYALDPLFDLLQAAFIEPRPLCFELKALRRRNAPQLLPQSGLQAA